MGPEVLNWAMQAPSFDIDDYFYFGRVDTDPACLFVGAESPLKTLDDVIAAGKSRRLNVGTSRMAHPASIGLLSLGEVTGADFNLIPLSGGKNTIAGAVTGEATFDDPALLDAYIASRGTPEYLNYGGVEECAAFKAAMLELGAKYKSLLSGARSSWRAASTGCGWGKLRWGLPILSGMTISALAVWGC